MSDFRLVRGTQEEKPQELEYGIDTVYERRNMKRIEETGDGENGWDFKGWKYEEAQYSYPEYVKVREERQQEDSTDIKLALAELAEMITGGQGNG